MKLNLGCNNDIKEGYINVDIYPYNPYVTVCNCIDLSSIANPGEVEEIYAKDILEHLPYNTGLKTLLYWCSLLKPGGKIYIQTTDATSHMMCYGTGAWTIGTLNYMLFAGIAYSKDESSDFDFHKSIYNENIIRHTLANGNVIVDTLTFDVIDTANFEVATRSEGIIENMTHNMNMYVWGTKQ